MREIALAPYTVLVVGAGGIGCPCAWALKDAGVGRVVIVDFDAVEPSNLPRQVLFGTGDVGRPKARVAAERLGGEARGVEGVVLRFDERTGPALLAGCDVAVDATDGASTKDLVHGLAVRSGKPFVHAAALGAEGRVLDVPAGGRPCLACVFGALSDGEAGDTCASFGVWPGVTGAVGALAAAAAIARLAAPAAPPRGLRVLDLDGPRAVTLSVAVDPACPVCGDAARRAPTSVARGAAGTPAASAPPAVPADALDLTQESCPMNMLRARRAVDALAPGRSLEIWLGDDGRESVPEGLAALGHAVVERTDAGDALRLVVRRGSRAAGAATAAAAPDSGNSPPGRPQPRSEPWLRRYARQVVMAGIGEEGQRRLGASCALVAGDGPAAEACAVHLAAAGVGRVVAAGDAAAALARFAPPEPAPGCGVPDVTVLVGDAPAPAGDAPAVVVAGDGAGGAVVRAGRGGARRLDAALPIARAAGALAADAAMRVLLGAPPAAGVAVRADGSVAGD